MQGLDIGSEPFKNPLKLQSHVVAIGPEVSAFRLRKEVGVTYRNDARLALARARAELDSADDHRLKYAALELRMAMESITFDRALAYRDEFPEKDYETWQPRKVMQVLLDVDPDADRDSSFSMGREPSLGEKPSEMVNLGTETVLNLSTLKAHYDALGSYLHVLNLKAFKDRKTVNFAKLRGRCEAVASALEQVLASRVWNLNLKQIARMTCECGKTVCRRLPYDGSPTVAVCECGATYDVSQIADQKVNWQLRQTQAFCPDADCREPAWLMNHEIRPGSYWTCSGCGKEIQVTLGLSILRPSDKNND